MLALGFVSRNALADWQNRSLYLPDFQFYERHRTVITTRHPEKILPAIADFDIQQDAIISALMSVRQLPQKLRRRQSTTASRPFGLHNFTLLENSASELCYGLRGEFWRADFGLEEVPDSDAYRAPLPPGSAKLLLRYQVQSCGDESYALCTETFIHCPDRATRLKMSAYWLAIRAGSGLIRQRTLKAVKRELERVG
jgi:hypothetical protein